MITSTGFLVNFLKTSLISRSEDRIFGPVLYHPTIFSRAFTFLNMPNMFSR